MPHYLAPIVCLIVFLQIEGCREIWNWRRASVWRLVRRQKRTDCFVRSSTAFTWWQSLVLILPVACLVAAIPAVLRDPTEEPGGVWGKRRFELYATMRQRSVPQLIFVSYPASSPLDAEWVYNKADLRTSRVVFAHDLGLANDRLVRVLPGREVWRLDAATLSLRPLGVKPDVGQSTNGHQYVTRGDTLPW
jgi:hypothetical protein